MDYLFSPWRYAYITGTARTEGCLFCEMVKQPDREAYIVHRGKNCYVLLNRFPYTSGHLMVVPYEHADELRKLPAVAAHEMIDLAQRVEDVLHQEYKPQGVNLGMNLGEAAGAGVARHLHLHILPRWFGDTNFVTVTGETRVLPESLDQSWERLKKHF
jgi:ATP adenylyltransferase